MPPNPRYLLTANDLLDLVRDARDNASKDDDDLLDWWLRTGGVAEHVEPQRAAGLLCVSPERLRRTLCDAVTDACGCLDAEDYPVDDRGREIIEPCLNCVVTIELAVARLTAPESRV